MRKGSGLKTAFLATALSVVGVLAGCAHPQLVSMGETQQEVIAYLGEPHAKTQMPDRTTRLTYSAQPYGQVDLHRSGRYRRFARTGLAGEVLQYAYAG